jgi:hypothetical protein
MTTDSPPPALPPARPAPRLLRPARFEDVAQIQALEAAHGMETQPPADWRGLWLDNPLWPRLGGRWPIGWVLEAGGRVVGSVTNVPSLYRFRGRELVCANGRAWVVAPEYRVVALWLLNEYFDQPGVDLFVNTTVGAMAAAALAAFSARVPAGDWEAAAYWVTGCRGFARKALEKKRVPGAAALAVPAGAALRVWHAARGTRLPPAAAGVESAFAAGFDGRFDAFWDELVRLNPDKLLAARDGRALAWHFAVPLRRGRLWILTATRGGRLRAYAVVKRQDGYNGLRRMRLIDYQTLEPDADLLPGLLRLALRRCAAEDFYVFDHLGCGLPRTATFDRCAPYRLKLPNWPYFYHAPDPGLAAELRGPEAWAPSSFDGDASFE